MKLQNIGETLILSIADDTWNYFQQTVIHRKMMLCFSMKIMCKYVHSSLFLKCRVSVNFDIKIAPHKYAKNQAFA